MDIKKVVTDTIEVVAKTALSVIPVGGTLITTVWDTVKGNVLAKRQEEWQKTVEERLSKTEETLESIGENELFATALIKATELAIKTSRIEKMEYLANAVVNSLKPDLDEEKLIIFLELLDKYTVTHIKILHFFHSPASFSTSLGHTFMMGSPLTILFSVYPELNNDLFYKIYHDLFSDGMVNTENLNITMTGSGMVAKRTTPLGDAFLNFIMNN